MKDKTKMCSRCKVEHHIDRFAIDPHTKKRKPACKHSNIKAGRSVTAAKIRKVSADRDRVSQIISSAWI